MPKPKKKLPELAPSPSKELAGAGVAGRLSGENGSGARLGTSDGGWSTCESVAGAGTGSATNLPLPSRKEAAGF